MKLSLVVAQGVHTGKVIPVTSTEFVIGRDPQCQLRPASPAVSKQHCGIAVRDGKVFVRDCGSTNGTFLNGEQIAGEREANSGDRLRVGPLEFDLKIENNVSAAASATQPAVVVKAAAKPVAKPAPVVVKAGSPFEAVPSGGTVILEPGAKLDDRAASTTIVDGPDSGLEDDPDHAAALLLGLDEPTSGGTTPTVESFSADPTTVMEMPALGAKPAETKKEEPKKNNTDSSSAAAEVLSKYMRRPRT
jgi:pSer/pThr/pTyr-binding forkhead associated (FHA) protein